MSTIFMLYQEIHGEGRSLLAFGSTLHKTVAACDEVTSKAPRDGRNGDYWIEEYPVDALPLIKHTSGYQPSAQTLECLRRYSPSGELIVDNSAEQPTSKPSPSM